jgi:prevent-host-death family protein
MIGPNSVRQELAMANDIISLTQFKNDASGWIERLQNQPPIVLTQNGEGKAVVQSYENWQQQRFAIALLKRVVRGQVDAAAGRTVPHEQVMAEVMTLIDEAVARKQEKKKQPVKAPVKASGKTSLIRRRG